MKFSRHCPRFADYEALFPKAVRLRRSLNDFYTILVDCCAKAVEVLERPGE